MHMKISKKALSVFMAVLMVMTSLSVGLTALAADPYDALAAALKADGVRHASWGSPQNYITVVNDPTGEIEAAAEAFWVVAAAEAPNHTSKNDKRGQYRARRCRGCADKAAKRIWRCRRRVGECPHSHQSICWWDERE